MERKTPLQRVWPLQHDWEPGVAFAGRAQYARRHFSAARPYLTPRKIANMVLNDAEMRLALPHPRSVPPYIKVESTPLCHLSCSGCAHGRKGHKKTLHNKMHLTVERIAQIIDPVARDVVGVSLSLTGEPLLNRDLPEIVAYIHRRGICTSFPTNLSVPLSPIQAEAFVRAGLDLMNVSLDGASEETYLKYRVGGRFSLILKNVRELADAKRRIGAKRPILTWKMVVFPHNEHEIETVKRTYSTLGFDRCEFVPDHGSGTAEDLIKAQRAMVAKRRPCFHAWNTTVIGWNGEVVPCCDNGLAFSRSDAALGNAADDGLRAVWQAEPYAKLRAGFNRKHYGKAMHPVCRRCVGLAEAESR